MTSKLRAGLHFSLQKEELGIHSVDVIPLNPSLVKGSHGLRPEPEHGPIIVGPDPPPSMELF